MIWDQDPGFLRLVCMRSSAACSAWLSAATQAVPDELPEDLSAFKNQPDDVDVAGFDARPFELYPVLS